MRHAAVKSQEYVEFVGRQEVPVGDRAAQRLLLGMVGDQLLLNRGIHAAVHAADALHEAHRVPVQVVIDQPRRVLEVQALGQHVGRNQDADFVLACGGEFGAGRAVVVGCEAADDIGPVPLAAAVDLLDALDPLRRLAVALR